MTEHRPEAAQLPDTDVRDEPGGTAPPGSGDLVAKPTSPGAQDTHLATAVPGAYDADDADEAERERGGDPTPGS